MDVATEALPAVAGPYEVRHGTSPSSSPGNLVGWDLGEDSNWMLAPEDMLLEDSGCGPCLRVTELVGDCGTALARAARREASRRNHADLRKRAHPTRFVRCTSQVREQLHAPSRAGKGNQFPGANQESMPESEEGREFGKGRGREALKQAAEPPTGGREEHQSCSGPQGSPEDFLPCTVDLGYSLGRSGVAGSCCAGPWEGCVSAAASGFGAQQLLQAISKEKDPAEGTGYAGEARGSKKPLPRSAPRTLSGELKNLLARIEVPSATLMHGARTLSEAVECKRVPRAAPAAARSAGSAKDVHAEALGPGAPALQTDGSCIHCAGNKKGCKHCKPDRWLYPVERRSCNGPTRYRGPLKPGRTWRKLTDCIASATPPMSSSGAEQNPTTTVALQGSSRRRSNPGCGVKPGPKRVRSQQQRGGHRTDVSKKKTVPRGHGRDVVAAEELEIGGQQFWRRQLEVLLMMLLQHIQPPGSQYLPPLRPRENQLLLPDPDSLHGGALGSSSYESMDQTLCNWLRHIMHGQQQRPRSQQSEHAGSKGSRSSASEGFGAAPSTRVGQSRNSPGPQTYCGLAAAWYRTTPSTRSLQQGPCTTDLEADPDATGDGNGSDDGHNSKRLSGGKQPGDAGGEPGKEQLEDLSFQNTQRDTSSVAVQTDLTCLWSSSVPGCNPPPDVASGETTPDHFTTGCTTCLPCEFPAAKRLKGSLAAARSSQIKGAEPTVQELCPFTPLPSSQTVEDATTTGTSSGGKKVVSRFFSPPKPSGGGIHREDKEGDNMAVALSGKVRLEAMKTTRKSARRSRYFKGSSGTSRASQWIPPQSPFGLIQEQVYDDPWKVMLCCILLNKTSIAQVRGVVWDLFRLCPTPEAAISTDVLEIENIIRPLGIHRKRARDIQQFSIDFLEKEWVSPRELHAVGKYGADAYAIFCEGHWREVKPEDKELKKYYEWLCKTGGLGTGLERDMPPE